MITATGRRWQATDATTWQPGPFHVREDRPDGKHVWWVDEEGHGGLGQHRLEDLLYVDRIPLPSRVVITEGEKACDAVRAAGLEAVATVCGAAGTPGQPVVDLFAGTTVVIWPDRDQVGIDHMGRLATRLEPVVRAMYLVDVVGLAEGADAADLPLERIRELVAGAREIWLRR